jgi:hypothetical protein
MHLLINLFLLDIVEKRDVCANLCLVLCFIATTNEIMEISAWYFKLRSTMKAPSNCICNIFYFLTVTNLATVETFRVIYDTLVKIAEILLLKREYEKRVLMKIFGRKRCELTGVLRTRISYKIYVFRIIKSRIKRWVRRSACIGEIRNSYKMLAGKPERIIPLEVTIHRW